MSEENQYEQAAAFQKIWGESLSKLAQVAFTYSPESAPPEMLRQLRSGIFQALGKSWEEYMRSPQFLDSMKKMMDQSVAFRKASNEMLTRAHQETQSTSQKDVDALMLSMRHMETRVLDGLEALAGRMEQLEARLGARRPAPAAGKRPGAAPRGKTKRKATKKGRNS